jgi:hypothetical protein
MTDARWSLHFAWGRAPYALDLPEVVIGRGDACTLQIQDDEAADEHARFIVDDDERVWIEDLGHPTLINGKRIGARTPVEDGDFVQIGNAVLTLRVARPRTETPPAGHVVGTAEGPAALQTLMMESPLAVTPRGARPEQKTIQVDSAYVLSSIPRQLAPPPEAPPAPAAPVPAPVARAGVIGESAPPSQDTALPSAPTTIAMAPVMATLQGIGPTELASASTQIGALPPPPTTSGELASASTQIGALPPPRARAQSNPDMTPLPAPLPPPLSQSIPDLGSLVNQVQHRDVPGPEGFGAPVLGEPTRAAKGPLRSNQVTLPPEGAINSLATRQLQSVQDDQQGLGYEKTALPREVPPEVAEALHAQNTQIGQLAPPVVAASFDPRKTQPPMPAYQGEYVPPKKGPFGSFSRALDFFQQMFALAKAEPAIKKPILTNIIIATPVMAALSALTLVMRSPGGAYSLMGLGVTLLYFIDYYCNSKTASLMYDHVTTGKADPALASARVKKSLAGIMTFAAVSAFLDVAATYARERSDVLSKILLKVLYSIWTTATYWIMPAMVIEGIPFSEAFGRSKKLMAHDPTNVGSGVVALSLVSYLIGAIVFPLAYTLMSLGSRLHPIVGLMLFFAMVNVYWAVTGWLKISYSTCFYLWARECERTGQAAPELAPLPLRHALDAG